MWDLSELLTNITLNKNDYYNIKYGCYFSLASNKGGDQTATITPDLPLLIIKEKE